MKKNVLSFMVISLLCLGLANAQEALPAAAFNDHMELVIPADAPLASAYTIDITDMGFRDQQAAEKFFRSLTDNLVHAEVDYPAGKATVHLHLDYALDGWGLEEWNNYFVGIGERYRKSFAYFNQ